MTPLRSRRLRLKESGFEPLSHYWIRYPAKFHPPVVSELLELYTRPGHTVLDPFCGSGTLLVEALAHDRAGIGVDIDPLAVLATRVKTRTYDISSLSGACERLFHNLAPYRPDSDHYARRMHDVGSERWALSTIIRDRLSVPDLPTLFHWFRPYVVVDLARIWRAISLLRAPASTREFLQLAFASSLRSSSNADPVPVSGVEYTAHMRRLDAAGRIVDPFANFERRLTRALNTVADMRGLVGRTRGISVRQGDATQLRRHVRRPIDALLTSPPYHNAVDYHRRHMLELFWLRLIMSGDDGSKLRDRYIGRGNFKRAQPTSRKVSLEPLATKWHERMEKISPSRAAAFRHYAASMARVFTGASAVVRPGGKAIFVVGNSSWNGFEIPTAKLFLELSGPSFELIDQLHYPLANRYMSYSRHNSASINEETVLVFRRRRQKATG